MADRIKLPIPQGALLPAEERLQNVLKAIEDRMREEHAELDKQWETLLEGEMVDTAPFEARRSFLNGLDIAWSLAKTETVRRGRCASKFTRAGLLPGVNECELPHGHEDLHKCMVDGGFLWSDTDAD